ncbi:Pentatricopeptide repeat-containing protein [Salix suchowensis]|nr:Pentatricopeptide repeat-containing protein [Salix suchowensis]
MEKGIRIDTQIFSSLLETCYRLDAVEHGVRIHRLIPTNLLRRNVGISSKLVRLYASCGDVEVAHQVFDEMFNRGESAFPWNSLIAGYTELGEAVHRDLVRLGFANDGFVLNALVDMYAKCGDIVKARRIFDNIDCYIRHGLIAEALHTFRSMVHDGMELDSVAVSTILANVSSFEVAVQIHGWIVRRGMEKLDRVHWLFDHMPEKDIVSWNSVISAHCKDPKALTYFELMERDGALPDKITFVSLLSACAHLGLVKDGERLFSLMKENYQINPIMEHYACMVNLYGRAGLINEAYAIIRDQMEFEAGPTVWGALLYSCYLHRNVDAGEIAAQYLFDLEPDNEHNFELLMKIYGNGGRLEDAEREKLIEVSPLLEG